MEPERHIHPQIVPWSYIGTIPQKQGELTVVLRCEPVDQPVFRTHILYGFRRTLYEALAEQVSVRSLQRSSLQLDHTLLIRAIIEGSRLVKRVFSEE